MFRYRIHFQRCIYDSGNKFMMIFFEKQRVSDDIRKNATDAHSTIAQSENPLGFGLCSKIVQFIASKAFWR